MKADILALLRSTGEYVSGQELCSRFGVSRTAVWKAVKQLREEGYRIEAVQNKGYKLLECDEVYGRNEIESRLKGLWVGRQLYFYEKTDSTNIVAKRLGEEGARHGALVVADAQERGRGRRGRSWSSPPGVSVSFTILLRPSFPADKASSLTLVMALSVARALEKECGVEAMIKWPNDIVIHGKKVCGILTEMSIDMDAVNYVVVGAGINANLQEIPQELEDKATSLLIECGRRVSRANVLKAVLESFEKNYEIFAQKESFSDLRQDYEKYLVNRNKKVLVLDPKGQYEGTALGINEKGELLVKRPDERIETVYAGEVSVRGVCGYV